MMEKYVLLITNRYDFYDRHWVTRDTLDEAEKLATEYTKDHKFSVEIYKLESVNSVF